MKNHRVIGLLAAGLLAWGAIPPNVSAQSISPASVDAPPGGGAGSVAVTAPAGMAWTVTSDDNWIQIINPASGSGSGNGTVDYKVLPDTASDINHYVRVGTIAIGGAVFTVSQHPAGQRSFEDWAAQLPGSAKGRGQDAAGNGIANIVKYALGLDASRPGRGGLPVVAVKNGVMTYTLNKPKGTLGVRYTVRAGDQVGRPLQEITLSKAGETAVMETWLASVAATNAAKFVVTTLVPVGVTAREVQKLLVRSLNTFDTNSALWNIQPGLGTVMIEYGRRFAMAKEAADAGDWGMAQYQLVEALEIQEVGETTRPAKAPLLKNFEDTYVAPLQKSIQAKDATGFATNFSNAIDGCNGCHAITGHGYVHFQAPKSQPEALLKLAASDPVPPATNAPPAAFTPAADSPLTWSEVRQLIDGGLGGVDTRFALWNIQPGLGTVMMEYGRRFEMIKLAVDAGDWGMAQYQLGEALEIQETGETTRPAKAPLLKGFEENYLVPLAQSIQDKNAAAFATNFSNAIAGCNACHKITGHAYARVQTPVVSPEPFLILSPSDPVPPTTNTTVTPIQPAYPEAGPSWADVQTLISNRLNNVDTSVALWNIQPGLGTVMQEYGYRFALAWFAAEAGNWGMAQYQLNEALEIQETGETTRPAKAVLLKNFEQAYLAPISAAITAKDKPGFETAYKAAIVACNGCHKGTGHSYVRVQVPPTAPPDFLNLNQ